MSDRYREYGRRLLDEAYRKWSPFTSGAHGIESILDSIPAPAPTQAESYDAPTGPGWWWAHVEVPPELRRWYVEWEMVHVFENDDHEPKAPVVGRFDRWYGPQQPPGTTTPDVQAQVDAEPREPIGKNTQRGKHTGRYYYRQAELDAAVAAEREACAKILDQYAGLFEHGLFVQSLARSIRARSAQEKGDE